MHEKCFYFSKLHIIQIFFVIFSNYIVEVVAFASNPHIAPFKEVFGLPFQHFWRNFSDTVLNRLLQSFNGFRSNFVYHRFDISPQEKSYWVKLGERRWSLNVSPQRNQATNAVALFSIEILELEC